jgi:tagatose-1,6-bisphosphate aldolase
VQELRGFADLLALDYPGSALAAASITAELDKPWIVSSRDQNYGQFKEELRDSLASGARGFLIGRSLWNEMGKLRREDQSPDFDHIPEYIQTTVRDRVIELTRIIDETAKKED